MHVRFLIHDTDTATGSGFSLGRGCSATILDGC